MALETVRLRIRPLVADDGPSIALLTRLGFHRRRTVGPVDDGPLLELYGLAIENP
jgi:hypothetical protein